MIKFSRHEKNYNGIVKKTPKTSKNNSTESGTRIFISTIFRCLCFCCRCCRSQCHWKCLWHPTRNILSFYLTLLLLFLAKTLWWLELVIGSARCNNIHNAVHKPRVDNLILAEKRICNFHKLLELLLSRHSQMLWSLECFDFFFFLRQVGLFFLRSIRSGWKRL